MSRTTVSTASSSWHCDGCDVMNHADRVSSAPIQLFPNASRSGRLAHRQLEFDVERDVSERRAFHSDVAPLAIFVARHITAWSDVDSFCRQTMVDLH
jgi:hypothetical protein